ncbi:MAG: M48 family metalloprotease [Pseudomonadales bacterium]
MRYTTSGQLTLLIALLLSLLWAGTAQAATHGAQWYNEYLEKDLLYQDQEWQEYVTEIGERLLAHTPHKDRTYTFVVTDIPMYDASATQDAYIFISRGIIAHFQREDELAGVIGHEIGHVVKKHHIRGNRVNRLGQIVSYLGSFATGSNSIYGLSRNVAGVLGAQYGREYELEADEYGTELLIKAGYDPRGLLDSMHGTAALEDFDRTVKNRQAVYHGLAGTHPATAKRLNELIQQSYHLMPEELSDPERDFWQMIDGLTYGDEAASGVVKDGVYYHGALRLTVKFPQDWEVRSTNAEVFGVPPQGVDAEITLKRQAPPDKLLTPLQYLTDTLRRDDLENGEEVAVGPYDAYIADVKLTTDLIALRKIAIVFKDGEVYLFSGQVGKGGDVAAFEQDFRNTVTSLRAMTGEDLRQVNDQKIKVIIAQPGDTYEELAKRVPLRSHAEQTLRLLNGHHPRGEPRAGDPIKIIQ